MLVVLLLVATAISFALWPHERESALPYEAIAILSVVLLNALLQRELTRLGRRLGMVVIAIALVMMGTIIVIEDVSGARGAVRKISIARKRSRGVDRFPAS